MRDGRKIEMTIATLAPMTTAASATAVTLQRSRGGRPAGRTDGVADRAPLGFRVAPALVFRDGPAVGLSVSEASLGASGIRTSRASGDVASGTSRGYFALREPTDREVVAVVSDLLAA